MTTNIFLYIGQCDRTDDRWLAGSLQQENSHSLATTAYNGVVLVQLGLGVGDRSLRGDSAVELPVVAVYETVTSMVSDIVLQSS